MCAFISQTMFESHHDSKFRCVEHVLSQHTLHSLSLFLCFVPFLQFSVKTILLLALKTHFLKFHLFEKPKVTIKKQLQDAVHLVENNTSQIEETRQENCLSFH